MRLHKSIPTYSTNAVGIYVDVSRYCQKSNLGKANLNTWIAIIALPFQPLLGCTASGVGFLGGHPFAFFGHKVTQNSVGSPVTWPYHAHPLKRMRLGTTRARVGGNRGLYCSRLSSPASMRLRSRCASWCNGVYTELGHTWRPPCPHPGPTPPSSPMLSLTIRTAPAPPPTPQQLCSACRASCRTRVPTWCTWRRVWGVHTNGWNS